MALFALLLAAWKCHAFAYQAYEWFLRVYTPFMGAVYLTVNFAPEARLAKIYSSYIEGQHAPLPIDVFFYTFMTCTLAAYGNWFMAICWIVVGATDIRLREKAFKRWAEYLEWKKNNPELFNEDVLKLQAKLKAKLQEMYEEIMKNK